MTSASMKEKILWLFILSGSLAVAGFMTNSLWVDYLSNKVSSTSDYQMRTEMKFPAITILNEARGNQLRRKNRNGLITDQDKFVEFHNESDWFHLLRKTCNNGWKTTNHTAKICLDRGKTNWIMVHEEVITSNGKKKKDRPDLIKFQKGSAYNTVTIDGWVQNSTNAHLSIQIIYPKSPTWQRGYKFYLNPPGEEFYEADLNRASVRDITNYDVLLGKREVQLMGKPYTDCVKLSNTTHNIFGGNYTVAKCQLTNQLRAIASECGISGQWRRYEQYFPDEWDYAFRNFTWKTSANETKCIDKVLARQNLTNVCKVPCHMTSYTTKIYGAVLINGPAPRLILNFRFENFQEEIIKQFPAYTFDQLFANFGGTLGLMCGSSILSIVELLLFFGIAIFEKIQALK